MQGSNPERNLVRTPLIALVYDTESETPEEDQVDAFQFIRLNSAVEIPRSQSKHPR